LKTDILKFANEMERVFYQNNDWGYIDRSDLLLRLKIEVDNLVETIISGNSKRLVTNCCNIALYAMLLAKEDWDDRLGRNGD